MVSNYTLSIRLPKTLTVERYFSKTHAHLYFLISSKLSSFHFMKRPVISLMKNRMQLLKRRNLNSTVYF